MIATAPLAFRHGIAGLLIWAGTGAAALTPEPAWADYRDSVETLRIGLAENHVAAANPLKLAAVRRTFAKALGIPVEILTMRGYAALIDAHASGQVGYAIHSARSFAATFAACGCVQALRTPVASDGSTGFRSILVVREETEKPIGELRIAYSNEDSVSGWQIPRQAIASGSLDAPQLIRAGSVAAVIELYQRDEVDGFFSWVPEVQGAAGADLKRLFGGWNQSALEASDPLRLMWSSQSVPYGPHAVHDALPDDLKQALGAFLDQMPSAAPGLLDIMEPVFTGGYVVPGPDAYKGLDGLVRPPAINGG